MTSRTDYNNPSSSGKLGLSYHYEMLSDSKRVIPFKQAIQRSCKDKRVFESGIGSGIMSILAARSGAKKVYASEVDHEVADFAQKNINKNGFENIIKIIRKDTRNISLKDIDGEEVDVAIAENLSTWEVNEPEIAVFNHINQNLIKANGTIIPEIIYNYLELANSNYRFEDSIELRTYYFEFTGISKAKILSEKILFSEIDLKKINLQRIEKSIVAEARTEGVLNSLRLISPLRVLDDIDFDSSDSLMPPVIIPLKTDMAISKGDKIKLTIKYNFEIGWDKFDAQAEIV